MDLILHVKEIYFREIQSGQKPFEYREVKPFWTKRLKKSFTGLQIHWGYPKKDDKSRIEKFDWPGFFITKTRLMDQGIKTVYAFPLIGNGPIDEKQKIRGVFFTKGNYANTNILQRL